jgi:CTP:molybdopterin cytidylyltransferase MocA
LPSAGGATAIVCANADEGMGVRLASAVGASGDVAGWVFALADMPLYPAGTIEKIAGVTGRRHGHRRTCLPR